MSKQKVNEKIPKVMSDVSEYIRLYTEANYPIRNIAKQCKTSVSTVYNAMVAAGFTEFRSKHSRASHTRMSMEQQAIATLDTKFNIYRRDRKQPFERIFLS